MFQNDLRPSYAATAARLFAVLALMCTPVSTAGTNAASLLFVIAALLSPELRRHWRLLYRHPVALAALLLAAALVASLSYSVAPRPDAVSWLLKYRKLLFLPLLIIMFAGARWTDATRYGLLASLLFVVVLSTSNYLGWTALGAMHNPAEPVTRAWVFKNHITAGLFSALLFSMCMDMALAATRRRMVLLFYVLAALALLNVFVMLQGRTGQIVAMFFCVWHAGRLAWLHRGTSRRVMVARMLMVAVPCVLLIGASLHLKSDRLTDIGAEYRDYTQSNEATSVGLRVEWYRKSLDLIAKRPVLGYGAGGVQYEFKLLSQGLTGAQGTLTQNPHNQFLLVAVELGLVGVALFVNLLVQIVRMGWALPPPSRNLLYAYLFAFTFGCIVNSLLLDFSEGYMFVMLTGILLGCASINATASTTSTKPMSA